MTDQPITPVNKNLFPMVTASSAALAGALVTVISYFIHVHYQLGLPDEVEKAIMTIIEFFVVFTAHRLTSN